MKLNMSMKILAAVKKCLILVIVQLSQNTMMIETDQSLVKRKEFVGLKPKMYSFLVGDNSEH